MVSNNTNNNNGDDKDNHEEDKDNGPFRVIYSDGESIEYHANFISNLICRAVPDIRSENGLVGLIKVSIEKGLFGPVVSISKISSQIESELFSRGYKDFAETYRSNIGEFL